MKDRYMLKRIRIAAFIAAALLPWGPAAAEDPSLTVVSWGGSYARACVKGYHERFSAETGISINLEDYNGGLAQIRAQVEVGNVYWDVVDLEIPDMVRGCDEGLLELVEIDSLAAGADGTPAAEDFVEGTLTDCGPATIFYSTVYAYNDKHIEGEKPATMADFFDLERFPGRRGMRRSPLVNLEFALIGDGVPLDEVYATLDTPEGVDRAFRKLDTIKEHIVWWEAGAQPPQMLADGEVVMTTAYNGRIFNAQVLEDQPFVIVWDGQVLDTGGPRHRRRHAQARGGAQVRPLRLHGPGHRRHGTLHRLQPRAQLGHGTDLHPRREGRGHEPPHAHERAERQARPAQQLGVVERPRRRDERALQHLAGAVEGHRGLRLAGSTPWRITTADLEFEGEVVGGTIALE